MDTPRPASFNSLPVGLRLQIWDLTFTPRILCLHIHRRLAPLQMGRNGERLDGVMRTVACSFTNTEYSPTDSNTTPESIFASFAERVSDKHRADKTDPRMGSLTGPSALGPVALYVCQESREMAKQRYELAFGGADIDLDGSGMASWEQRRPEDKAEWDRHLLSSKKIWVDFTHDIIFIDGQYRKGMYSKCSRLEPLTLIRTYAREEAKKIRRLAIRAVQQDWRNDPVSSYVFQIRTVIEENKVSEEPHNAWMADPGDFDAVEELLLEDTVGEKYGIEERPAGEPNVGRFGRWDEEVVKGKIMTSWRGKRPKKGQVSFVASLVTACMAWMENVVLYTSMP